MRESLDFEDLLNLFGKVLGHPANGRYVSAMKSDVFSLLDVVEVAPPFDHADVTVLLGNRVVLEALSAMARRRQDERDGTTWDPSQPLLDDR